jgi:pimeloyl-ACP methyl ester carboxylesterase
MSNSDRVRWILCPLAAAVVIAGCAGDSTSGETSGSLSLSLELAPGLVINEVRWEISRDDMEPMVGTIDTSAPGATASVEVFGLPPGDDYLVELEAIGEDSEVACRGNAEFDVEAGRSTDVMVMLNCKPPERLGGVRVNGKPNICPELVKVVVSPLQTSIGNDIELSALAVDADDDPVSYFWFGSGGSIANPTAASTTYTCERDGQHLIAVFVSEGLDNPSPFAPCTDRWFVEVTCVDPTSTPMCRTARNRCNDGQIDDFIECCESAPLDQENACAGDEPLENPASCTPTGNTLTHKLTLLELAPSCNDGYDLDGCDGGTCFPGGLSPGEGLEGVDNALTGLAPLLEGVGFNLRALNQAISDGLCGFASAGSRCSIPTAPVEIQFLVDANPEEKCANVQVRSGPTTSDIILNLGEATEDGTACASGTIGTIPISIAGYPGRFENAVVRMTVSEDGFSDGLLGVTIDEDTAVGVFERLIQGGGAVIAQVLDIREDLTQDTDIACNAMSAAFAISGTTGSGGTGGTGGTRKATVLYDRTDPTTMSPFPDDYWLVPDASLPTGYRVSLSPPAREADVQVLYLALMNETRELDGFSPTGGIVIELSERPDRSSLPLTPAASLDPMAAMGLFDLTPGSDTFGQRIPFELSPLSRRFPGQLLNHSLVLYPSIPLSPKARYAMVVMKGEGLFEPSAFMTAVLGPETPGEAPETTKARDVLEDGVLDVLGNEDIFSPPITVDDIALVLRITVRSTDTIPLTPLSMKEQILALPPPSYSITSVGPGPVDVAAVVRGTWQTPNWREDQYFVSRDVNGDPQITGALSVPFVLAIPQAATDGPVPVVMFQHGSPGSSEDVVGEAYTSLAEAGFAVIGFTDTLNRELGLDSDYQSTVLFETLIQKWRFPHFKLQTYADQMGFLRVIEQLGSLDVVPLPSGDGVPDLDLAAPLTYVGISMGSMHGSAFLSFAPEIKAAALVAGAQRQGEQYFRGGDFLEIFPPNLAELLPHATPTDYWIGLSIFQMIFDHQDAHQLAENLYRKRLEVAGTTRKASILVTEGVGDFTVPNNATRSLAWNFGPIPHLAPIWDPSPILKPITGPVTANIDSETTAAFYQFVPAGIPGIPATPGCEFELNGHFCAQVAPDARLQRALFLRSAVDDPVPTIVDPIPLTP